MCLLTCLTLVAFSQETVIQSHTALTTPHGRIEFGLLNSLCFVLTDTLELSTQHVLDALLPNLVLKVNWLRRESFYFTTEHELNYPTMLLKVLQVAN